MIVPPDPVIYGIVEDAARHCKLPEFILVSPAPKAQDFTDSLRDATGRRANQAIKSSS